ncbi:hypothetical protein LTR78_000620 [Recurvomyces mirabilis]|uniref:Major facilitator superfamily (MFS) profile domain-containing protein n=1 Tax=Recurvomyces mirabilis TaxID=574656 RepID=A0AAE0WY20_9PEZI|nr:hypothetical protein LTR78_000620 [Recurvomyces mirabilis]KAK5162274.1 hypothetical protein LTS14_000621 [Recurvomyces mirabilis]
MARENDERQQSNDEQQPLLGSHSDAGEGGDSRDTRALISFTDEDKENPRQWTRVHKMTNVFIIALMSILSPLASSMFTPGIEQIAESLETNTQTVIGCTTGFVIMLGVGPLILAPLSETFGRRIVYLVCFTIFTLLQIPSALAPNIATLIAMRTLSGLFGSVGIANGGGTISDMFPPKQRAGIFGWYLLGPLLGPTLGPLFGGIIVQRLDWRWIFWVLTIVCAANTIAGYIFLKETFAPVLLQRRKQRLENEENTWNKYRLENEDDRPFWRKLASSLARPPRILFQPIVLTMSTYQALIFGTTYSIYTNMQPIYQGEYGFNTEQVGLLYLGPGLGFLAAVWFLVPRIDTVYNRLTEKNGGKARPEFRLPLANIGAILIPISLFWFAWTVEYHMHWIASISATFFYGLGQVMILNTTQNYYIDSFEKYAASAIAAGALFRSLIGGVVPLLAPAMFDKLGYGWGVSVFGFLSVAIAPAPIVLYYYGQRIREAFTIEL